MSTIRRTRVAVYLSLGVALFETGTVAAAAVVTGSSAVLSQTFANVADVGVQVFLLIAVVTSARAANPSHPLGYGRERFFWSLLAAIGVFAGGCAVAFEEAIRSSLHPTPVTSFAVGYIVLAITVVLDCAAFAYATRTIQREAQTRGLSLRGYLRRTTEPTTTTELLGNGIGVTGALLAIAALAVTQATGNAVADALASGLIGLALIAAAVTLIQRNRDLLTGRGIAPEWLEQMRRVIAAQPGVLDVPDLFAVVVGPATLIVDGDLTFDDDLTAPQIESAIDRAATALRTRWPTVGYVYLTPVSRRRPRGQSRPLTEAATAAS
jgi:cation diffusion facilitator family transporter